MDSIVNMTVEEFLERTPEPDGDGYTITVKRHKTDKKDDVHIYVSKSTYNLMNFFYQGIRKEMNFPASFYGQTLFCTVKGGQLIRCDDALKILNKFIKENSKFSTDKQSLALCDDHCLSTLLFQFQI